jgi:nuclear GTP-binding protein
VHAGLSRRYVHWIYWIRDVTDFAIQGGILDTTGASRILLRDWGTGKFPRFTLPPSASTLMSIDSPFSDLYASDEKILATLSTRKERRKAAGVVKLSASELETRKIALETPWLADDDESDAKRDGDGEGLDENEDEDEDEDASGEDDEGSEEDEDIEMDEEEDEEEEMFPPIGKRKRSALAPAPARPAKKVSFAEEPKLTKPAHSAAGAKGSSMTKKASQMPAKPVAKPKSSVPTAMKKAANAKKPALAPSVSNTASGEETYDFKKFF